MAREWWPFIWPPCQIPKPQVPCAGLEPGHILFHPGARLGPDWVPFPLVGAKSHSLPPCRTGSSPLAPVGPGRRSAIPPPHPPSLPQTAGGSVKPAPCPLPGAGRARCAASRGRVRTARPARLAPQAGGVVRARPRASSRPTAPGATCPADSGQSGWHRRAGAAVGPARGPGALPAPLPGAGAPHKGAPARMRLAPLRAGPRPPARPRRPALTRRWRLRLAARPHGENGSAGPAQPGRTSRLAPPEAPSVPPAPLGRRPLAALSLAPASPGSGCSPPRPASPQRAAWGRPVRPQPNPGGAGFGDPAAGRRSAGSRTDGSGIRIRIRGGVWGALRPCFTHPTNRRLQ